MNPPSLQDKGPPPPLTRAVDTTDTIDTHTSQSLILQLSRSIECLEGRIERAKGFNARRATTAGFQERLGPFTSDIIQAIRPSGGKSLKINRYHSTTDPYIHIDNFCSIVAGKIYTVAESCHAFQETLTGEELSWFFDLKSNSVGSFVDLCDTFASRFILRTDGYHTTTQLFKVLQGEQEILKDFVNRWQSATTRYRDLKGSFLYELNASPPADYKLVNGPNFDQDPLPIDFYLTDLD